MSWMYESSKLQVVSTGIVGDPSITQKNPSFKLMSKLILKTKWIKLNKMIIFLLYSKYRFINWYIISISIARKDC